MMTIDDIRKLIANDEHRTLELKKTTGELKDGMHAACAFLNTDGGWLIFGVASASLKILGQDVTETTRREIAQALNNIKPSVDVRIEYVDIPEHPDNKIIAMHFDPWAWGKEPYFYHGRAYYRVESTTKEMSAEMLSERMMAVKPHKYGWENQIADDYSINDLNEKHIMNAVRMGVRGGRMPDNALSMSCEDILKRFSLLRDGRPLQAAVALFAKDTWQYPQLLLRLARFEGTDKIVFIDNQQVRGNFFELLDAGMAFCYKHLNLHGRVIGMQRIEYLDIPREALREALINALCHRSYDGISSSVSLAIYADRIEIANPGRFPPGVTPENIKQYHESKPYNPLIASVLYKTTWLESWGSGIKRIMDSCQAQQVPEPYYKLWCDGSIVIVFPLPDNAWHGMNEMDVMDEILPELTERQQAIYDRLVRTGQWNVMDDVMENVMETATTLTKLFGVSERTIRRDLAELQRKDVIRRDGSDKSGRWIVVRYNKGRRQR